MNELASKARAPTEEERQCEGFGEWSLAAVAAYTVHATESATGVAVGGQAEPRPGGGRGLSAVALPAAARLPRGL